MSSFLGFKSFTKNIRKPFIQAKNIHFSYTEQEILKNFSFTLQTSKIVAIVGRSGEGKSTFLHLLTGVLASPKKGAIRILGKHRILTKKNIGFVPQEIALIPEMTIEQNIQFFGHLQGMSKDEALTSGKELMKTLHLPVPMTKTPSQLSGGQKVRLNIIVSILHNPSVLILDEPFVGLDYYNRKLLWHFLQHQKNRRKAVILTTHMLVEAEHFTDELVVLHKGKVFAKGKLKDIRKKLKTLFIAEYEFSQLTKSQLTAIKKYCFMHDITIMNEFNNYMMFSISRDGQRAYLTKFFDKEAITYSEVSFREPNLDELFLKVAHI
ncbi:MAG: ABC transporter ATP-binding protein [Candidatus Woesearchaeota archaeon]